MASVTFDHVVKQFGDVKAVNDLNVEVQDKEFLVLVGPQVAERQPPCVVSLDWKRSPVERFGSKTVL
jgi:ABC-type lipopolysaccharide export system ATPase subunit